MWKSRFIWKICTLNLLIAAAATGMFGVYIYYNTFSRAKEQLLDSSRKSMQETITDIESAVMRIEMQAGSLLLNEIFNDNIVGLNDKAPGEIYDSYQKLNKLCAGIENVDNMYQLAIVFSEQHKMMNNGVHFFYDDIRIAEAAAGRNQFWIRCEDRILGDYIYGVRTQSRSGEEVFLLFNLYQKVYHEWIDMLRLDTEGYAFLENMQEYQTEDKLKSEIMEEISGQQEEKGNFILRHNGSIYFVLFGKVSGSPFYAVSVLPSVEIENKAEASVKGMFVILIPIFLLTVSASYVASVGITGNLRRLVSEMNRMYQDKEEEKIHRGKDEIGMLEEAFYDMQERVDHALEETRQAEKKQRIAEMSLLQAQINPHFLYNTLDSINWLAMKTNAPEISFIVKNMSDYFRTGLNAGSPISTLGQEIFHVTSYFNIQKFRFQDRICLYIDVPEELLEASAIVLMLQPVVENAIIHGILADEERKGKIVISAELVEDTIIVYVEDDGIGIEEECVKELNRKIKKGDRTEERTGHGFGLYSVNQRIQYYFGEEYGLDIISQKGEGTTCILTFPLRV